MFYMHDVGWGWEFLMVVGMVAFWALVVLGVVLFIRGSIGERTEHHSTATPAESALEILDRRLANGEISVEEYQERRTAMEDSGERVSAPV